MYEFMFYVPTSFYISCPTGA